MNIELFIAQRLYKERKGGKRVSRPAITIAQLGVSVGLIIMMLSVAIIVGFKHEVRNKIVGFGSHINIINPEVSLNGETFVTATSEDIASLRNCEGTAHIQTFVQKPGLISVGDEFEGIMLKGIGADYDNSFIQEHLVSGAIPPSDDTINTHWVLLSQSQAKKLNCTTGDKVSIYFLNDGIKARKMLVAGIYETHLYEMDNLIAYTGIATTRKLNGWEEDCVSGIEITATEYDRTEAARTALALPATEMARRHSQRLSLLTIEEQNPALFAWLEVLDRTVWVILILVLGIAGFTMVSGLLILILEKSNLIGILKAIGARDLSIRKIFLYYACFIIGKGMLWGNIIAIIICVVQQQTGIVALDPEMYYMDTVPIEFSFIMIPMNIFMFVLSVGMLLVPSMLISKIEPSKAIKFE